MKKALETALTADNPPSTKHLSRRLGYADDQLMPEAIFCALRWYQRKAQEVEGQSARENPAVPRESAS
jgi:hypothetical protein